MNPNNPNTPDTTILRKAGLTESQAKGYLALIEHGELTPVELATSTGESRTNGYMICEKLESLGLAVKKEGKKALYSPAHPSALEVLAEKRRKVLVRNEQEVKQGISPLIDLFYASTEMPGTRTLQGVEGIKEVFDDTLRKKSPIYLIRSPDTSLPELGYDFIFDYREKRAQAGITTYALTPDSQEARHNYQSGEDARLLMERTFIPIGAYTAPVEIDIYGDKVAFIGFGDTQMTTLIQSAPVAAAMREIHAAMAAAYTAPSDAIKTSLQ